MRLNNFIEKLLGDWFRKELIEEKRLKNKEDGYDWVFKGIEFTKAPTNKEFQKFFDRADLNKQYREAYLSEDAKNRKPYLYVQSEIDTIYSLYKSYAMRYHRRADYYRNDMSQKGIRTIQSTYISLAKQEEARKQLNAI